MATQNIDCMSAGFPLSLILLNGQLLERGLAHSYLPRMLGKELKNGSFWSTNSLHTSRLRTFSIFSEYAKCGKRTVFAKDF